MDNNEEIIQEVCGPDLKDWKFNFDGSRFVRKQGPEIWHFLKFERLRSPHLILFWSAHIHMAPLYLDRESNTFCVSGLPHGNLEPEELVRKESYEEYANSYAIVSFENFEDNLKKVWPEVRDKALDWCNRIEYLRHALDECDLNVSIPVEQRVIHEPHLPPEVLRCFILPKMNRKAEARTALQAIHETSAYDDTHIEKLESIIELIQPSEVHTLVQDEGHLIQKWRHAKRIRGHSPKHLTRSSILEAFEEVFSPRLTATGYQFRKDRFLKRIHDDVFHVISLWMNRSLTYARISSLFHLNVFPSDSDPRNWMHKPDFVKAPSKVKGNLAITRSGLFEVSPEDSIICDYGPELVEKELTRFWDAHIEDSFQKVSKVTNLDEVLVILDEVIRNVRENDCTDMSYLNMGKAFTLARAGRLDEAKQLMLDFIEEHKSRFEQWIESQLEKGLSLEDLEIEPHDRIENHEEHIMEVLGNIAVKVWP